MAKSPDESILFHGEIINKKVASSFKFPVNSKFHFKNASYNDTFTVVGVRKEPGSEYRQVIGSVAGEVWMLLSSLQNEAAVGTITFPDTTKVVEVKETKKGKTPKKTNKNKTKGKVS